MCRFVINQLIMQGGPQPIFSHVEPIFPVRDIPETIKYWQEVLGFPNKWTWGDPPGNGGVSWQKAFVQFLRNPALAAASKGNAIWIRLHHVEELYTFHQSNRAEIVAPLEVHPYGMAQYSVREINGYYVHFAGNPVGRAAGHTAGGAVTSIRIMKRKPTAMEYSRVQASFGGGTESKEMVENIIATATFAVVAEDTVSGDVIGCGFMMSDGAGFFYVKNVMVKPEWQRKGVGTALMNGLMQWLEQQVTTPSLVGLFARESLEPFYQQFGFLQSFGMVKEIGEGS
jgi:GNAT superfamily N-acetyltransferase